MGYESQVDHELSHGPRPHDLTIGGTFQDAALEALHDRLAELLGL